VTRWIIDDSTSGGSVKADSCRAAKLAFGIDVHAGQGVSYLSVVGDSIKSYRADTSAK
jgi:hypothetical protein